MKTTLIWVGKTMDKRIVSLIDDYAGRIVHYMPFQTVTIPDLKSTKSLLQSQQKDMEGTQILKYIQASDYVVLLDEREKEEVLSLPNG